MRLMEKPLLVLIVGPTASGKTSLAIALAKAFESEIISFDSRQFYKELAIGAAIPTEAERETVPHHFIADRSYTDHLNAGGYEKLAIDRLNQLFERHPILFAVGGSGLFAKALVEGFDDMSVKNEVVREHWRNRFELEGLEPLQQHLKAADPVYASEVDLNNHQRLIRALEVIDTTGLPFSHFRKKQAKERPFRCLWIGIDMDRNLLHERINQRVIAMMEAGLVDEARGLYPYRTHESLITVGYRELFDHFDGQYDLEEAIRLIQRNTRHFARRQMTWFNKNKDIHWFQNQQIDDILRFIRENLKQVD
jgi:tRNA dimethylallyltransferase